MRQALLAFLIAALALAAPARAAERVALVIGNTAYAHARVLPNARNDARAIAALLKDRMGFEVTAATDLGYRPMRDAIRAFGEKAQGAQVALIYYAGHGLEVAGENYLLPTDASIGSDADLEYEAVTLASLLDTLRARRKLSLVILDACRNNPLADRMRLRAGTTRSVSRGLARVEPAGDILVAYAAKAGTLAEDGKGANSPYAEALLHHLPTPGLDIRLVMGRVRDMVLERTENKQEPFTYGSLPGREIALMTSEDPQAPRAAETPADDQGARIWNTYKATQERSLLDHIVALGPGSSAYSRACDEIKRHGGFGPACGHEKPRATSLSTGEIAANVAKLLKSPTVVYRFSDHPRSIDSLAFSPDGRILVSTSSGNEFRAVRLYSMKGGNVYGTLETDGCPPDDVAFLPSGDVVLPGDPIGIWGARTQRMIRILPERLPGGCPSSIAVSPNGRIIATTQSGVGSQATLTDATSGRIIHRLTTNRTGKYPRMVVFSPDGRFVAGAGGYANQVWIWDAAKGALTQVLSTGTADAVAFSPDGLKLAVAGCGEPVQLWNVRSGQLTMALDVKTYMCGVRALAFSSDGRALAGTGNDDIWLWDLMDNRELGRLTGFKNYVKFLVFSPDGRWLATGGCAVNPGSEICSKGQVQVWGAK